MEANRPGERGRRRAQPLVVSSASSRRSLPSRHARAVSPEILRRRRFGAIVIAASVLMILVVGLFLWTRPQSSPPVPPAPDFSGPEGAQVVFHVTEGEGNAVIGQHLVEQKIVMSKEAFLQAGENVVIPGYYVLPTHISGSLALTKLAVRGQREVVGYLGVPGSRALDGTITTTGKETPAIFDLIAEASCVTLNGVEHCISAQELRAVAENASLEELGIPWWARDAVKNFPGSVPRHRRLEGLIVGDMNFDPQADPLTILRHLIITSTHHYEELGLIEGAKKLGWTPYQTLVGASLIEREVVFPEDLPKVARVMLNRIAQNQPLQFDSTINYILDKQEVGTSDEDRNNPTLWNTYVRTGLTPSPICSPSYAAIQAMLEPAEGSWMFFVTVDEKGTTLFSDTYEEHLRNVETAQDNGFIPRSN